MNWIKSRNPILFPLPLLSPILQCIYRRLFMSDYIHLESNKMTIYMLTFLSFQILDLCPETPVFQGKGPCNYYIPVLLCWLSVICPSSSPCPLTQEFLYWLYQKQTRKRKEREVRVFPGFLSAGCFGLARSLQSVTIIPIASP